MIITKERTRLIFTEFNDAEFRYLENLVASMDNVFMYVDPDGEKLGLPTGMEKTVKAKFPKAKFINKSDEYWPYEKIKPVDHNAQPRNQLQIDFINFVLENAKKNQKLAGILSVGTGKQQPNSTKIPAYSVQGYILMGDLEPGDIIYGSDGKYCKVIKTFPQGLQDVYAITLEDDRVAECGIDHLWNVYLSEDDNIEITTNTGEIMEMIKDSDVYIPAFVDERMVEKKRYKIVDIKYVREEESSCILVDSPDHLYVTEDYIITHNTFMACYSAIAVGERTLIIAPTSSIKKQWADTLTGMFNVPEDRVLLVDSPKKFINVKADFVVVSQASLAVLNKTYDLDKIMRDNKFGIKIIDEVQMWFKNIINIDANSNIANNWYLTGTFGRSGEDENKLFQEMFGDLKMFVEKDKKPTIFNRKPGNIYGMKPHVNTKMIWTKSGLSKEEIASVTNSMRYSQRTDEWMRMGISVPAYTNLVIPPDGSMTKYLKTLLNVIRMANKEVNYGSMLVLVPTIAASDIVAGYCKSMFPDKIINVINSHHSGEENAAAKKESDIVVSTVASAGTGFDMKGLAKLIFASPLKSWVTCTQVLGRLRRRDDGRDTYAYDLVDSDIRQLRAWASARAEVERKMSKTFKVVDM